MEGIQIDGNNILSVYDTMKGVRDYCIKNQKPYLIECITFRMRGHEEASGTKYIPQKLFEIWELKDPVKRYEEYLRSIAVLKEISIEEIRTEFKENIEKAINIGFDAKPVVPDTEQEIDDVYAKLQHTGNKTPVIDNSAVTHKSYYTTHNLRLIDSIKEGLYQSMKVHQNLILMGQDIAEYGGVFKVTENFVQEFGRERVRNTPLCESAILGAGLGLSVGKMKSVIEMQFADFVSSGFTQVVNNLAKIHYRWGQNADVVVRMPTGAGVGAGPFHSQSNEGWFFHTPGLKVVYPSSPYDVKGLLLASIADPNPVMFFEHKFLYRSVAEQIPDDYYTVEIGKANLLQEGDDV